MTYQHQ
jgi:hypothetical protein